MTDSDYGPIVVHVWHCSPKRKIYASEERPSQCHHEDSLFSTVKLGDYFVMNLVLISSFPEDHFLPLEVTTYTFQPIFPVLFPP